MAEVAGAFVTHMEDLEGVLSSLLQSGQTLAIEISGGRSLSFSLSFKSTKINKMKRNVFLERLHT